MFSRSSPCLLGQHGSCSSAQLPVELTENMLQNLFLNLPPQTVEHFDAHIGIKVNKEIKKSIKEIDGPLSREME